MKNRNKKMILAILLLCVVATSIGFAAFSGSLIIKSHLSVDPSATDFSVIFSKDGVAATQTGAVKGVVTGTNSTDVTDINTATIDNTKLYPTISNLGATLTEPGQSVSYTFYAKNIGKYNAYLTSIVFQNLTNSDFIECIPKSGTSAELVESLCKDISVSITVGSNINTNSTLIGIENHKLTKGANEPITITLSYGGSVLSDGPFKVAIGNIYLTYGSQSTGDVPFLPNQGPSCYISSDKNVDGTPNIGDEVTCGNETFYVIDDTNSRSLTLLSKYNLNLSSGLQSASDSDVIAFYSGSSTAYWYDASGTKTTKAEYFESGATYPFVYDFQSDIYPYVESYETELKNNGVYSADASLITYNQLTSLGCGQITNEEGKKVWSCIQAPEWLYANSFWSGSARDGDALWRVIEEGGFGYGNNSFADVSKYGIRPIITISRDEFKSNEVYKKEFVLINDNNENGIADVGDEVAIGDEYFYVIPNDTKAHPGAINGTVTLLAKYNLDVGSIYNATSGTVTSEITPLTTPTYGIQSSNAIGYISGQPERYGIVQFSYHVTGVWSNYWHNTSSNTLKPKYATSGSYEGIDYYYPFVYDSYIENGIQRNMLYDYVESYKTYIESMGVSTIDVSIPSYKQFMDLGCRQTGAVWEDGTLETTCRTAPSWVYLTSYWLGSALEAERIWAVLTNGTIQTGWYGNLTGEGVRPVVIVDESYIRKPVCKVTTDIADATYGNTVGTLGIGDEVTCGTEEFLVIPNDTVNHPSSDNTVSLLSKPMIGKNTGEATTFSDTTYWLDAQGNLLDKYSNGWVYDENSNLYSYIEDYETKLKNLGVSSAYATVPSLYQVQQLGCSEDSCPMEDSGDIMNFVSNVFWLGNINTNDSEYLYLLDADYSGSIITGLFDEDWSGGGVYNNGLNALVIVDKIDIQPIQN